MTDPMTKDHEVQHDDQATRLHEIYRRLDIPGVYDIHTHFMPQRVLVKVWNYFDNARERLGMPWPIEYRHEDSERIGILRKFGVLKFSSLLYPHKPQMAEWLNDWAHEFATQYDDCLQSATFYPEDDAARYVRKAIDQGARIFKSHVQVGAYDPTDQRLEPVWSLLETTGHPIVIHAGSGPEPGPFTEPEKVTAVLQQFPRLHLVIAHMGMPEYESFLHIAAEYDNVFLDTTMNFTDFAEKLAPFPQHLTPQLGELSEKIVFGSDFPNIPYTYVHAVDAIDRLGLGEDFLRSVLYTNPRRILGEN